MLVVLEPTVFAHEFVQDGFAFVAEGRMAKVMCQRDGFGEVFVELEWACNVPGNCRDFHRVGEARAEMVTGAVEKNLGFVFEAAERAGVNDAIAVALILRAPFGRFLVIFATARVGAELSVRSKIATLDFFEFNAGARHGKRVGRGRENSKFQVPIPNSNSTLNGPAGLRRSQAVQFASSRCTEMPRSSNRRRIVSSIRLFGQEAPAVTPTVTLPDGSQFGVSTSLC